MEHETESPDQTHKVDRLLDAIELVKADRREDAVPLLRSIIREDADFEEAWLWMSVAVDEIDQSIICLDNVLRINPENIDASTALYRLRQEEILEERRRERLRRIRDTANVALWLLIGIILFSVLVTINAEIATIDAITPTIPLP